MQQKKYRVKSDKIIYHGGVEYTEGATLWLVDNVAAVHAENIEEVEPDKGEKPPELLDNDGLPVPTSSEETPPQVEEAIAILDKVADPKKKDASK